MTLDPGLAFGTGTHPTTQLALAWLQASVTRGASVLDYGCGSGILAIAAAKLGAGRVLGTDIDPQAIEASTDNARINAVTATFVSADGLPMETFDLVVSNPPYIPTCDIDVLQREVREHDPRRALDGGADGLDAYRAIARQAANLLTQDGALIVEIGIGQEAEVPAILTAGGGLESTGLHRDLSGIARALSFRRTLV